MPKLRRDNFTAATKRALAQRAGNVCSLCAAVTAGPSDEHSSAVNNVGVAAHICGALPGSARHNPAMTSAERCHADNGIWLCQTCAKLVDSDVVEWTMMKLLQRKVRAEQRAKEQLGARRRRAGPRVLVEAEQCYFIRHFRAAAVPVHIINEGRRPVTVRRAELVIEGKSYGATLPVVNLSVRVPWLPPPPLRLQADDAADGAWFFGYSFEGGGQPVEASSGAQASLVVATVGSDPVTLPLRLSHPDDSPQTANQLRDVVDVVDDGSVR